MIFLDEAYMALAEKFNLEITDFSFVGKSNCTRLDVPFNYLYYFNIEKIGHPLYKSTVTYARTTVVIEEVKILNGELI